MASATYATKRNYRAFLPIWSLWLGLTLFLGYATTFFVTAQQRGPITVHFVNDSAFKVDIVWLNNMKLINGDFVPEQTGPLPANTKLTFQANVNDRVELHQVQEECAKHSGDMQCKSEIFRVMKVPQNAVQANIFILNSNFQGMTTTNEACVMALFGRNETPARMRILNQSGGDVDLFWVNSEESSLVPMSDSSIPSDGPLPYFSASVFHQFLIRRSDGSRSVTFRVTDEELDVTISPDFTLKLENGNVKDHTRDTTAQSDPDSFQYSFQPEQDLFDQCIMYVVENTVPTISHEAIVRSTEHCVRDHYHQRGKSEDEETVQAYIDKNWKKRDEYFDRVD